VQPNTPIAKMKSYLNDKRRGTFIRPERRGACDYESFRRSQDPQTKALPTGFLTDWNKSPRVRSEMHRLFLDDPSRFSGLSDQFETGGRVSVNVFGGTGKTLKEYFEGLISFSAQGWHAGYPEHQRMLSCFPLLSDEMYLSMMAVSQPWNQAGANMIDLSVRAVHFSFAQQNGMAQTQQQRQEALSFLSSYRNLASKVCSQVGSNCSDLSTMLGWFSPATEA